VTPPSFRRTGLPASPGKQKNNREPCRGYFASFRGCFHTASEGAFFILD
jgi:hypothetical protein